jgi:hypothetical protein
MLNYRGMVVKQPIGAFAHVGHARSHAMHGDTAKARAELSQRALAFLFPTSYHRCDENLA